MSSGTNELFGGLQAGAGALATYYGMPQIGVPMMVSGAATMAGGGGQGPNAQNAQMAQNALGLQNPQQTRVNQQGQGLGLPQMQPPVQAAGNVSAAGAGSAATNAQVNPQLMQILAMLGLPPVA